MANIRWQGGATALAQEQTYLFGGTWETDDLIRITIGSKVKDFTAGSTTIATIVSTLVTAFNALSATDFPEFGEMTASVGATSSTFKLTSDTRGKLFTVTLTPLEANGGAADLQTIEGAGTATTGTTLVSSAGPNDWSTAKNWSGGVVPANTDSVYIDNPEYAILYGLNQSAVTLTLLEIAASYADDGRIGLPEINEDATAYFEYRDKFLRIGATTANIGTGEGNGSDRIKIDFGSVQTTTTVRKSAAGADTDLEAIQLKGTHASNVVNVAGDAEVGIAAILGDVSTVATLRAQDGARVRCGSGVTLTTVIANNAELQINSAVATSITLTGSSLDYFGSGNLAQLTMRQGSTCNYRSSGTLNGNTSLADGSVLDFSGDPAAKTVTNPIEVYDAASRVVDPFKVVSSLIIDYNENLSGNSDLGTNVRITRGTPA